MVKTELNVKYDITNAKNANTIVRTTKLYF